MSPCEPSLWLPLRAPLLHLPAEDTPAAASTRELLSLGLAHAAAYNRVEALRALRLAAADAACAACHWAVARAMAHDTNHAASEPRELDVAVRRAVHALRRGESKLAALVRPLVTLTSNASSASSEARREAYAEAMCGEAAAWEAARGAHDADLDAQCALALMATTPWDYYDKWRMSDGEGTLKPQLQPAARLLSRLVAPSAPPHALALHLHIHLHESTAAPWEATLSAVQSADALRGLLPTAGHLEHMPAHLYLRVGRWHDGVAASDAALAADEAYLSRCLSPYAHGHNLRMGGWHARMMGAAAKAEAFARRHREDARRLAAVGAADGGADAVSALSSELRLTLLRFGDWEGLASLGEEEEEDCAFPSECLNAASHLAARLYSEGMALEAASHSSDAPHAALAALAAAPPAAPLFSPPRATVDARLTLAELNARRAFADDDGPRAAAHLRDALSMLEEAAYSEPPAWYYDVRDCLGYVLLHSHPPNASAALEVHQASLRRFPRSGWALLGAAQALEALGEAHAAEAYSYREQFEAAWAAADAPIASACPQFALRASPHAADGKVELGVVSSCLFAFFALVFASLACGCRCRPQRATVQLRELPMEAVVEKQPSIPFSEASPATPHSPHLPAA
ncbi:hypothetical protein AB1Y20_018313 [Prymnesium parvum]|uniref:KIF-binding protein n=1 Tax=Prymnesium parvum TaxID=97485 RepID=A0AB34JNV3_PRYPA